MGFFKGVLYPLLTAEGQTYFFFYKQDQTADLTFAKVLETVEIAERDTKDAQNSCMQSV